MTADNQPAQAVGDWWAVTIDSQNPERLSSFWAEMLGATAFEIGDDRAGWYRISTPRGPHLNFQPSDAAAVVPSRLHVDVLVSDLERGVARALALGATDTGSRERLARGDIAVLRDPDGNAFCLLAPPQ